MFVVVGLGNPGAQYEKTRHNVGFFLLDIIAAESGVTLSHKRFHSLTARTHWNGFDVFLAKPQCFMNLSGDPVQQMLTFFKIPENQLIVIFDDLDQLPGAVRTRLGGGHGGHNGMRDILAKTGLQNFYRVKIGIGKPQHKHDTAKWVLSKFSSSEAEFLEQESLPLAKKRILDIMKQELPNLNR